MPCVTLSASIQLGRMGLHRGGNEMFGLVRYELLEANPKLNSHKSQILSQCGLVTQVSIPGAAAIYVREKSLPWERVQS